MIIMQHIYDSIVNLNNFYNRLKKNILLLLNYECIKKNI